jgi:hypothetical protein
MPKTLEANPEHLESALSKIRSVDPGSHEEHSTPAPLTQQEAASLNIETKKALDILRQLDKSANEDNEQRGAGDVIPYVRGNPDTLRDWNVTYPAKINRLMKSKEPTGKFSNGKPRHLWIKPQSVIAKFIGGAGNDGIIANPHQNTGKSVAIFSCTIMDPTEPERPLLDSMLRDRPSTMIQCSLVMEHFEDA